MSEETLIHLAPYLALLALTVIVCVFKLLKAMAGGEVTVVHRFPDSLTLNLRMKGGERLNLDHHFSSEDQLDIRLRTDGPLEIQQVGQDPVKEQEKEEEDN